MLTVQALSSAPALQQAADINNLLVVVLPRRHHFNWGNSRHQLVSESPCSVEDPRSSPTLFLVLGVNGAIQE
jgi:hypothetical protein